MTWWRPNGRGVPRQVFQPQLRRNVNLYRTNDVPSSDGEPFLTLRVKLPSPRDEQFIFEVAEISRAVGNRNSALYKSPLIASSRPAFTFAPEERHWRNDLHRWPEHCGRDGNHALVHERQDAAEEAMFSAA